MKFERASGVLLHLTSLPSGFGIGDLGPEAYNFVDFLRETGQTYWQILPLGPTGFGDSPYQCFSAFAGNTLLISPEKLVDDGLLSDSKLQKLNNVGATDRVDYGAVYESKGEILREAYYGFQRMTNAYLQHEFEKFCRENAWWLDDYALYRSVKADHRQKPWFEWPVKLRLREADAIRRAKAEFREQIQLEKFLQFIFFRQWFALKEHANRHRVRIIGDLPFFVALDSADVWCNQDEFKLNADGSPEFVAGVPPDYFSRSGQLWGNPIYNWEAMATSDFSWWTARFWFTLRLIDIVRVDHFRGFVATWEVPGNEKTAENGQWVNVPGRELFAALKRSLGDVPVIAEDLGFVTPEVEQVRDELGFPGMRILQFAFDSDAKNRDLPHNYLKNCVAYTGTHDNDTTVGWWQSRVNKKSAHSEKESRRVRDYCLKYLGSDGREIHWDFIRAVWASIADTAIAPMQDILGIGTEGRMNLPATTANNWQWRIIKGAIRSEHVERLRELTEIYGRAC